jgi:hypothetical protein
MWFLVGASDITNRFLDRRISCFDLYSLGRERGMEMFSSIPTRLQRQCSQRQGFFNDQENHVSR